MVNSKIYSRIVGTGSYLPREVVSNYDLEKKLDTSHDWIVERTGIERRHISSAEETVQYMGVEASKKAMNAAGVTPAEIDLIIVATTTSNKVFPAIACVLQKELDIPCCVAFDVQAACSGFIYILSIADKFIKSGVAKKALIVGSEVMSNLVNWEDRRTAVLFGDGAGAVVLSADESPGVLSTHLYSEGKHHDILYMDKQKDATLFMQGNAVFKLAVNMLDSVAMNTLSEAGFTISDIDWLIPHQANLRIIQATAEKLGIPKEKLILTVQDQGNTSAASIPLALDTGISQGKIVKGQHLLLEAIGAGLTWGTALIRY